MEQKADLIAAARSLIGLPYRFGGSSPQTGFDCSGLVCWSYEQVGISLPRRASEQIRFGHQVNRKEDLQPGDIVVFKGTRGRTGWHSGIYTGEDKFVHSPSTGKTVTESSLSEEYYARRFVGARRIPRDGSAQAMLAAFTAKERSKTPEKLPAQSMRVARSGKSSAKSGLAAGARKKAAQKSAIVATSARQSSAQPAVVAAAGGKRDIGHSARSPKSGAQKAGPMRMAASGKTVARQKQAPAVVDRGKTGKKTGSPTGKNIAKAKGK
jgi:cell wall-associated NlpC family hydrolase